MANNTHVPKFGNWDNDNVAYTAYFENARKQKTGAKMNPNDPEQNPEAFMRGGGTVAESDDPYAIAVPQPPNNNSKEDMKSVREHADQGQRIRHRRPHQSYINSISTTGSYNKSITLTESNSDEKSSSDSSLLRHRRTRSDKKKSASHLVPQPISTDNSFPHGHGRHKSDITNHSSSSSSMTDPHHRATSSIPKFGEWNEADPRSGEGFTAIFEKVKQEKQIAFANLPTTTVPQQPCNYMNGTQTKRRTCFKSKMCCCLFSNGSE
ncbi:hypothetical protein FNV43_RR07887 [Rhamnella rubrinervis]|uniref:RIN4 pathogenic type III effector avirulence factor Avr cleavage site domain-containing protein n=1 Tax=Rhamnella rubrinervis TaxID=2594499 RepID=A0A8K0MMK7_9ROSA|nr:hypothetical protein FNV43_RR07887 [Rhamnella rubrinervis]